MSTSTEQPTTPAAEVFEGDHTALVHVLWSAKDQGLTLDDADELARFIRRSQYQWAVQDLAANGRPSMTFTDKPEDYIFRD